MEEHWMTSAPAVPSTRYLVASVGGSSAAASRHEHSPAGVDHGAATDRQLVAVCPPITTPKPRHHSPTERAQCPSGMYVRFDPSTVTT